MMAERNALAELAKELKQSLDLQIQGTSYYRDRTIFCTPEVIDKVQRIIAELARVQPDYVLNGMSIESLSQLENTYANIRAIAEEGDKDGE